MSTRRPALVLDDPLGPGRPAALGDNRNGRRAAKKPARDRVSGPEDVPGKAARDRVPDPEDAPEKAALVSVPEVEDLPETSTSTSVAPDPAAVASAEVPSAVEEHDPIDQPPSRVVWREWGGGEAVKTMRLPAELVAELDERTRQLRLPIGVTHAAALAQLLDQSDEDIVRMVERAEDARAEGRRRARRASA